MSVVGRLFIQRFFAIRLTLVSYLQFWASGANFSPWAPEFCSWPFAASLSPDTVALFTRTGSVYFLKQTFLSGLFFHFNPHAIEISNDETLKHCKIKF